MAIGVREAKAHLSEYLRRVKAGEVVTITDRGQIAAYLVPPHLFENHQSNVELGLAEGWITAPDRRGRWPKIPRHKASVTVTTLLDDDRGE